MTDTESSTRVPFRMARSLDGHTLFLVTLKTPGHVNLPSSYSLQIQDEVLGTHRLFPVTRIMFDMQVCLVWIERGSDQPRRVEISDILDEPSQMIPWTDSKPTELEWCNLDDFDFDVTLAAQPKFLHVKGFKIAELRQLLEECSTERTDRNKLSITQWHDYINKIGATYTYLLEDVQNDAATPLTVPVPWFFLRTLDRLLVDYRTACGLGMIKNLYMRWSYAVDLQAVIRYLLEYVDDAAQDKLESSAVARRH